MIKKHGLLKSFKSPHPDMGPAHNGSTYNGQTRGHFIGGRGVVASIADQKNTKLSN